MIEMFIKMIKDDDIKDFLIDKNEFVLKGDY